MTVPFVALDSSSSLKSPYQELPIRMTVPFLALDSSSSLKSPYQELFMTVPFLALDSFIVVKIALSRASNDCAFSGT